MGATSITRGYPDMTLEKAKKAYNSDRDHSLYEDGHSYSGCIGMLGEGRVTQHVFPSQDAMSDWFYQQSVDKNNAIWVQVKVVRSTRPLEAADLKMREANKALWAAEREKKAPSVIRTMKKRADAAKARHTKIHNIQADKSKKTTWYVLGWAAS